MDTWFIAFSFASTAAGVAIAIYGIHRLWHAYNETLEDLEDLQLENTLLWERNRQLTNRNTND